MQETVLTHDEAAAYLKISPRTLDGLLASDNYPAFTLVGARRRFRVTDLDEWLEKNKTSASD